MVERNDGLPIGWALLHVSDVGAVRVGRQRSPDKQTGRFATRYIRAANITSKGLDLSDLLEMDFTPKEREVYRLRLGDVVLTEASGSAEHVGRAALWREERLECCYQNTVIRFRPHAAIPEFALLMFQHFGASGVFAQTARGVGIQHLGVSRFAKLPFPLPPRAEQQRIVAEARRRLFEIQEAQTSLLSALQRIEEQNREILAAAVQGQFPGEESSGNVANQEAEDIRSVAETTIPEQPELFDDTAELTSDVVWSLWQRPLPPGWKQVRLGAAGDLKLGRQRSPKHQRGSGATPYLRVANVQEDAIDLGDLAVMDFGPTERKEYQVRRGDILLNVGQSPELVGRPALIRDDIPLMCFQNHLARFRAKSFTDPEFALIVFRHYLHTGVFRSVATWSTNLATLGISKLASLPFPLPPLSVQRRIASVARIRLEASRAEERAVRDSLKRLPAMEAELLAAAVGGSLVPQDPADEPADAMLRRLGTPLDTIPSALDQPNNEIPVMTPTRENGATPETLTLGEVLRAAGPLTLPDLFSRAGYDRDSTEDVEQFYLALRTEMHHSIRSVGSAAENGLVEAIPNAPR